MRALFVLLTLQENAHAEYNPGKAPARSLKLRNMTIEVTQIDHVSVLVTDLEQSRRFYRDLLGLKEIAKPRTFDFKVLWFDLGNQHLHLLLKEKPDVPSPRHFALRV